MKIVKNIAVAVYQNEVVRSSVILLIFAILMSVARPYQFLTSTNLFTILRQTSINAILAMGLVFVIITKGIDLSVGSIAAFTSLIAALILKDSGSLVFAIFGSLSIGIIIGVIVGWFVSIMRLPPFIVTLATMTIFRSFVLVLSQGKPVTSLGDAFGYIGTGYLGVIPFPVVIMIVLMLLSHFLLDQTKFGRYVYAIGDNEEASVLSGINVTRVKIGVYVCAGLFAAVSGLIMASRVDSATPTAGTGYELDAIAACVMGGVSLAGGKGSILGALIGALVIGILNNGMILLEVNIFFTGAVKGFVILAAVLFDRLNNRVS